MVGLHVQAARTRFPALAARDAAGPRIYFDNPAGTQVPMEVINAMQDCLLHRNANLGGPFVTSLAADEVVHNARRAMSDLLNARSPDEIVFGQNMTSLAMHIARSFARRFGPGDEIIVTRMDHDANVTPWTLIARDAGLTVRHLDFDHERYEFDLSALEALLNERTRLVCVGHASNVLGTINDIASICRLAHDAGALIFVDSVHFAPHGSIDVQALDCDLLACSAYKFFGPHQGILWARGEVLSALEPYRLRPAPAEPPGCFETGTQSHEGLAGVTAAVDYLASLAGAPAEPGAQRRAALATAFEDIALYELELSRRLIAGLQGLPGVRVHGITADEALSRRTPTVSFTAGAMHPARISEALAAHNVFTWSGHSYAIEPIGALGLLEAGGVLRVGLAHYNLPAEIDRFVRILESILN